MPTPESTHPESVFTHGAMEQQRLLVTAPDEVTDDDLGGILTRSPSPW